MNPEGQWESISGDSELAPGGQEGFESPLEAEQKAAEVAKELIEDDAAKPRQQT